MATLSQTAANVSLTDVRTASIEKVVYGTTVTQGQPLYLNPQDNKHYPTNANAQSTAKARAIALTPGIADESGVVVTRGNMDLGGTLTVGTRYYVGASAGTIEDTVASGDWPTLIGIARESGQIEIQFVHGLAVTP